MNTTPSSNVPVQRKRSVFVTILGWVVIVGSVLLLPVSFISLLMILTGSPGSSSVEPLGALIVLGGPLASLVAGIGLLLRRQWARWFLAAVLSAILVSNLYLMIRGPIAPYTYTSADGVPTTVVSTGDTYSIPLIVVCSAMLLLLFTKKVREEFAGARSTHTRAGSGVSRRAVEQKNAGRGEVADAGRGWRVGHRGRDAMYYEERHGGQWKRIEIDGEMLMGRAHHIIYFASPERWQSYPEWARDRRDEIMARIKSEFREPDYEYYEGGGVAAEGDRVQSSSQPEAAVSRRAMSPESARARTVVRPVNRGSLVLVFAILLLLGISGGMTWLVTEGAVRGETYLPTKLSSQRRVVSRVSEPAMYWVSIGIYTGIGGGSLGLALLGIWESWNLRKGRSN